MPEALAIFAIFVVSIAVWISARLQAANPALQTPQLDRARLRHHADWLQHRLQIAQQENWDAEMIAGLQADLAAATRELARRQEGSSA